MTKAEKLARAARAKALLAGETPLSREHAPTELEVALSPAVSKFKGAIVPINPQFFPKTHDHGALKRGDSVWFKGERHWIEYAPTHWSRGCFVRISSIAVHPDTERLLGDARHSFCIHPDLLTVAPMKGNVYAKQPSRADDARKTRAAHGERDIGDEIATMLRACKSFQETYARSSEYLGVPVQELEAKYSHLNPGQQRMNLGNRMRAKWRKEQK